VEKVLTALTRSMEYGRSSVYALMTLLNLEVVDRLMVDGEVQEKLTHMGGLRCRPTSFVNRSSLYSTNPLTLASHAAVSVSFV